MPLDVTLGLLIGATAVTGILAGASLDQSIKQLPARHKIGATAFSKYSQAADLGNGVAFYATIGIAAALLNIAAAVSGLLAHVDALALLLAGGGLAIAHSAVTARAVPLNFSQRRTKDDAALTTIFDRFARLQALRCVLQLLNFWINLWALIILAAA